MPVKYLHAYQNKFSSFVCVSTFAHVSIHIYICKHIRTHKCTHPRYSCTQYSMNGIHTYIDTYMHTYIHIFVTHIRYIHAYELAKIHIHGLSLRTN